MRKQFGVSITLDRLHEVRTVAAMARATSARARHAGSAGALASRPPVINHIWPGRRAGGHRITFVRLDGTEPA